ncbi:MAG: hypothetical protein ACREUC_14550, partial [Steroidobacteraceae bacterium]
PIVYEELRRLAPSAVLLLEEPRSREDLSGRTVGPYQLAARGGAGGSGDVYLARDTRLDRDVALKVLPETLAADAERIARFKREAQLLASLNHPNIAAIYGFEGGGAITRWCSSSSRAHARGPGAAIFLYYSRPPNRERRA